MDADCNHAQESQCPAEKLAWHKIHWKAGCADVSDQNVPQRNEVEQGVFGFGVLVKNNSATEIPLTTVIAIKINV